MKKTLLPLLTFLLLASGIQAQEVKAAYYSFTKSTGSYNNLISPTSVNNGAVWGFYGSSPTSFTDVSISNSIPNLNFFDTPSDQEMEVDGNSIQFYTSNGNTLVSIYALSVNNGQDGIVDKGYGTNTSKSPIDYQVTGSSPNRIVKIEWNNASHQYSLSDYMNVQIWLYESNNAIEFHYGPSSFANASNTDFGVGINSGLRNSGYPSIFYNGVSGTSASPEFTDLNNTTFTGIPASGTIYRFVPLSAGVNDVNNLSAIKIYPTLTSSKLNLKDLSGEKTSLNVYDVQGKLVLHENEVKENSAFDVSALVSGMYFIELSSAGNVRREKFVKI